MYYIGTKELEDRDVILASCELCIDSISRLPPDDQLSILHELYGYLTEKLDEAEEYL